MGFWSWLFGPPVPRRLRNEEDYTQVETVLLSNRAGKILKALRLVEETGTKARRLISLVEPLLQHQHCSVAAARALWGVSKDPRALEVVQRILAESGGKEEDPLLAELGLDPATEALLALSFIAKDDPPSLTPLLNATASLIGVLATSRGSGDVVNKVFNAFTSGDDNSRARYTAATLTRVACDHTSVKQQLIDAVKTPQNKQQKMYAALALGFAAHINREKMEEAMSFMNAMFDSPSIPTAASRNEIRDNAIAAGLALASAKTTTKEREHPIPPTPQERIRFRCPHCEKPIGVGRHLAGKRGKCPSCGKTMSIPATQEDN